MKRTMESNKTRPWVTWLSTMLLTASHCWLATAPSVSAQQDNLGFHELKVEHITAEDAKQQIGGVIGNSIEIIADNQGKRLLLRGSAESIRISRNLLQTIDKVKTQTNEPRSVNSLSFQVPATQHVEVSRYLQSIYTADAGVSIASDSYRNQLIIQAPDATLREISEVMASQGFRRAGATSTTGMSVEDQQRVTENYKLRNVSYRELESILVNTWGSELVVQSLQQGKRVVVQLPIPGHQRAPASLTIDRIDNQIILDGAKGYVDAWKAAIQNVDSAAKQPNQTSAWLKVANSDSRELQQAVSYLRLSTTSGKRRINQTPAMGGNADRLSAQPISARTFQEQGNAGGGQDAGGQDFGGQDGGQGFGQEGDVGGDQGQRPLGPVDIEFIPELGLFIVRGTPEDVARVRELVQEIEELANQTQPEVRYIELQYADSTAVATIAQQLYDTIYQARQGTVTITALGKPNAVMAVGRKEAIDFVEDLIRRLDVESTPDAEFKVIRLKYMSSEDAKSRLNEFYLGISQTGQIGGGAIQQGERPGLGTRMRVVSDYRSNSIIVQASPGDMKEIERFIESIDVLDSDASNEVKVFQLKNALAEELQPVLQDALNGQLQGGGLGANPGGQALQQNQQLGIGQQQLARLRSAMLALKMINQNGEIIRGGIMYDVRITADTNSNSLVVTGPAENMPLIGALIQSLDRLPDVETKIKVFSVINNDAGVLLQLLTDLFSTTQGGGQQGGASSIPPQFNAGGGESNLVGLRFSADPRTNSIIASGSESNLRVVEDLLYRLDQEDLHRRIVEVFRLRNTISDNVVAAIQDWLSQRATLYGDGGDAVGVPFSREVIVVSEPEGNSIIVSATPEYFGEVRRIIEDLDRRPMFMIHCLIAEVDLGSTREFGFEWGIQDSIVFNRGLGVASTTAARAIDNPFNVAGVGTAAVPGLAENLAGMAVSDVGLSRTNSNLGYGGLVMSAGNESINLLMRALQAQNRIQILSTPTIMTLDNIQGYVQVGEQVRYLTESTIVNGAVQNTTEPVDTGIILQVRPRLSPDGLIVMDVDATNSSLGNEADGTVIAVSQNGDPIRVPPINITTAQTTIMARHGQTTVFAGLIATAHDTETRGVPILADIPAVGRLFRFDADRQIRSELLILLTPYIVDDEADVAQMNQIAFDRMNWCLTDVVSQYGPIGYDDGEVIYEYQPDVIYPDLDPAGKTKTESSLPTPPSPSGNAIPGPSLDSGASMFRGPTQVTPSPGAWNTPQQIQTGQSTRRGSGYEGSGTVKPAVLDSNAGLRQSPQVQQTGGYQYPSSGQPVYNGTGQPANYERANYESGQPLGYDPVSPESGGAFQPVYNSSTYSNGGNVYR